MKVVTAARDELFPWGWDAAHRLQRVALFGATSACGRELLRMLLEAGHPAERLTLFAAGARTLEWHGEVYPVHAYPAAAPAVELAFLMTDPGDAREQGRMLAQRGARVVDLSGAWREDRDAPVVVPEVNAQAISTFQPVYAMPVGGVALVASLLHALDRLVGLEDVVATVLESAAASGLEGIVSLRREVQGTERRAPARNPFAGPLAGNVFPFDPRCEGEGGESAEHRFAVDLRRVLGRPELPVEATLLQVPVERCSAVAVSVALGGDLDRAEAVRALEEVSGVAYHAEPDGPRALECAGTDLIHVGRIRTGSRGSRSLCFFAVGDRLRKGAALNALQVASRLPVG